MSDALKMIWAKPNYDGEFDGMFVIDGYPIPQSMDSGAFKYVRADEHDRIVAEKDAEIARLHDKLSVAWTVIETLRARLDTARNDALDDAARRLLRCFPNMGMIDEFADAIRALKDRNETEPEREPDNRTDNLDNRLDGEREET
jgi:hypothetical protein